MQYQLLRLLGGIGIKVAITPGYVIVTKLITDISSSR